MADGVNVDIVNNEEVFAGIAAADEEVVALVALRGDAGEKLEVTCRVLKGTGGGVDHLGGNAHRGGA